MAIRFGELSRGSGKIYQKVYWDDMGVRVQARAIATSASGRVLPVNVVQLSDQNACIVILAIFVTVQSLRVTLVDGEGVELALANRSISASGARLTSQLNTLRKNALAEEVRNIDERQENWAFNIELDDIIYITDVGANIVRGRVHVLAASEKVVSSAHIDLCFFNKRSECINDGVWTPMGDSCHKSESFAGCFERTLAFSVEISPDTMFLACWASIPELGMSSIRCLQPFEMRRMRQLWVEMTDSAQTTVVYDEWFRIKHKAPQVALEAQRAHVFAQEPDFSIVVPVYRTPIPFLREMIDSVLAQTYAKWELILVNASPEDKELCSVLLEYANTDCRIRLVELDENKGIVGNTYAGVALAKGEFVSFFDHDDVLEPDLLWRYVEGINEYPTTDLLYCDEDKLQDGKYVSPFFKPDWSPDLLMSENYVCHMLTVRKLIVDALPPMVPGEYDGSQDHFLTLFAGERARNVFHARRVLYHWRMHAQSTAANADSKSYTEQAGVRAIQAHLDRCGIAATARPSGVSPNTYHVEYHLDEKPMVSIIIPNKDMVEVLGRCVDSILSQTTYNNYEIVIVENNSTQQETFAYYESLSAQDDRIRVVEQPSDGTFNFSRTINYGVKNSKGDFLLFLNNDTEVRTPDWIERMLGPLVRSEVGIVGVKLLYPDGLLQHAGVFFHTGTGPFHVSANLPSNTMHYYCSAQLTSNFSAVTAACMMTRRSLFDAVGGFNEQLSVDYNDIDYCLRAREKGSLVVYEPTVVLMHYESISRGSHLSLGQRSHWTKSTAYLMSRWTRYYVEGDPYCNPNLSFNAYHRLKWDV